MPRDRRPNRVVFVNRFFYPDVSATSQILGDVAFRLAAQGVPVTVVTSRALYGAPGRLRRRETIADVEIVRVYAPASDGRALRTRLTAFAGFYVGAAAVLLRLLKRGDVLVIKTDPPLFSVIAAMAARLRGARRVNWLQDLYPEVAIELGVGLTRGWAGRLLKALRNWSLAGADMNVAIGDRMFAHLQAQGIADTRLTIIPNWADDHLVRPQAIVPPQRHQWGLDGRFVVGYSGNLGKAHEIDTLLSVAGHYRNDDGIRFLFIGGGALRELLEQEGRRLGLANILWQPYQPRERLPETLAVPDLHWLTLVPQLEGLIVPSKLYGIMAAGRPFVFVGVRDGEVALIADRYACGVPVATGDVAAFVDAIERFRAAPELVERMGLNGREAIDRQLGRDKALARWTRLLRGLLEKGQAWGCADTTPESSGRDEAYR